MSVWHFTSRRTAEMTNEPNNRYTHASHANSHTLQRVLWCLVNTQSRLTKTPCLFCFYCRIVTAVMVRTNTKESAHHEQGRFWIFGGPWQRQIWDPFQSVGTKVWQQIFLTISFNELGFKYWLLLCIFSCASQFDHSKTLFHFYPHGLNF